MTYHHEDLDSLAEGLPSYLGSKLECIHAALMATYYTRRFPRLKEKKLAGLLAPSTMGDGTEWGHPANAYACGVLWSLGRKRLRSPDFWAGLDAVQLVNDVAPHLQINMATGRSHPFTLEEVQTFMALASPNLLVDPAKRYSESSREELEVVLPEPMGERLQEAHESMVSYWDFNREKWPGETRSQWEEDLSFFEEYLDDFFGDLGQDRLTSPIFWDHYQVHRQTFPAMRSLLEAAADTPELEPNPKPYRWKPARVCAEEMLPRRAMLHLVEAREGLWKVFSDFFRPECKDRREMEWKTGEATEEVLERLGVDRLSSLAFWGLYQAARDAGLPPDKALDDARDKTPHEVNP